MLGNDGKDSDQTSKNTFPLTGINTDEGADRRIVGVMINNHPAARPQSGLSQADIVFEMLAEGNMTRFLAFFQSEQPRSEERRVGKECKNRRKSREKNK